MTHFLVAGNAVQARHWCDDHQIDFRRDTFMLMEGQSSSRGRRKRSGDTLHFIGTWQERRDLLEVYYDLASTMIFEGIEDPDTLAQVEWLRNTVKQIELLRERNQ